MLKSYIVNGKEYRYEEGKQPKGAVELRRAAVPDEKPAPMPVELEAKAIKPRTKVAKPSNKAGKGENK